MIYTGNLKSAKETYQLFKVQWRAILKFLKCSFSFWMLFKFLWGSYNVTLWYKVKRQNQRKQNCVWQQPQQKKKSLSGESKLITGMFMSRAKRAGSLLYRVVKSNWVTENTDPWSADPQTTFTDFECYVVKCNLCLSLGSGSGASYIIKYSFPLLWLYMKDSEASAKPKNLCCLPSTSFVQPVLLFVT